jgi:opine dehydrogenase
MTARAVTIIGNGAGGCAAAGLLALNGTPVTLYGRSTEKVARLASAPLIMVEEGERQAVSGIVHTDDLVRSLAGDPLVVLMVPTSAITTYASALAPHLRPDARVLLAPGHTGGALAFRSTIIALRPELQSVVIAETFTLPFVTRMTAPNEVTIWRRMHNLLTGVIPARQTASTIETFSTVFPALTPATTVLESSLSNLNAVMHPPGMLMNVGWIESTGGDFRFYREGVTPGVARVMDGIDRERLAVATAFGIDLPDFVETFRAAGLVADDVAALGSTYEAVHESEPNRDIRSPSTLTDRYVAEDVGMGLVALVALASSVGVATPVCDALIVLAGTVNGCDYSETGLTAAVMGVLGLDRDGVRELVS